MPSMPGSRRLLARGVLPDLLALIIGGETDGFLEVRSALPGRGMRQEFFPVTNPAAAQAAIRGHAPTTDVFIGAAPRMTQQGGRSAVPRTWCLWVDCDNAEATERLAAFAPAPTLTIASGTPGNTHAWWRLERPIPAMFAEQANRRLAHHVGADPRCAEVARIMRPPGTLNHKHDPPAPVELVGSDTGAAVLQMVARLPDPPTVRTGLKRLPPRVSSGDRLLGVSPQEYVPRLTGRDIDSKGYVQCPFHEDWRPSLMAYEAPKRGWYCYQCERGGTVYDFAAELWGFPLRGSGFSQLKERLERVLL